MTARDIVMKCAAFTQRNAYHCTLGCICGLADRFRHFARFAVTEADATLLVADNNEGCETETTAALHNFCNAIDVDETIHKFGIAFFAIAAILTFSWFFCHFRPLTKNAGRDRPARFELTGANHSAPSTKDKLA
jgi:hypothetical protein